MSDQYTYARFWRCALQVNPVGYNGTYRGADHGLDEAGYNQALLQKCLELGITVVGLADHGSVASVDALRQVLQPHGIVVFPGFEIASNDKTHYVCLFPEDTTVQHLDRYLGNLKLLDPADGIRPSRLSSEELIEEVDRVGGFIYGAHCTQESGLLKNRLNHVWKHPKLRAAQIPGSIDDLTSVEGDFYRKVFLNKDDSYRRERPVAAINAKDVAKPDDLEHPGATCFIKMTRPNFAAFKVAFLDPGSRIRLNSQQAQGPIGKVVRMTVAGGYLDGVRVDFSDHLNTVIGGRGTGKSTLLECLRFALDLPPKGKQAQKLHQEITKENLGRSAGRVELTVVSSAQNGKQYTISRRHGEPPMVRDMDGNVSTLLPRDLLPGIDIYGQNEIYELAQDETSRVQLLDRFLPQDGEYEAKRADVHRRLKDNQQKLTKSLTNLDDLNSQVERLPKLEEQLRGFDELGIKEKLAKTSLLAREREIAKTATDGVQSLRDALSDLRDSLPDLDFINDEALEGLPDAAQLLAMRTTLDGLKQGFTGHLTAMQALLDDKAGQFTTQHDVWQQAIQAHDVGLEKALRTLPATAGKSGQEVGVAYQKLLGEIERIKPMKSRATTHQSQRDTLRQERRNLLTELSDLRGQRIQALQKAAKQLNRRLEGKLKVEIVPEADRTPLMTFLLGCKLDGVGEKRLAFIEDAETISPLSLAQSIQKASADVQLDWGVTQMVADALTKLQSSQLMELEALELEHRADISLNVAHAQADAVFRPLNKLSTGQQCTAILHMLLLENVDPLLMDQPEDNLDNAFIADRIVAELREAKTSRQFLFATHNANIPVFGDAEWIGVFTAAENQGCLGLEAQGSIDVPVIRDQVARLLEGGRDAFIQRKEKYEF
ncbi:TrlF family AAA-like ATPase [Xanthomonas oryzae]|uniref:ATPase involved in DNA repair n=1 Tax=Xanthomonas oryzae pv. oryzae (strain KACC10331 / KXO85) TaxID=291331 RepID=Q5GU97_XANOR|nr:AAA family ATPase [Xanthomonas oryzae]AAW77726.1 ATPase involved in DNA repair [Xanthomonas oryzae pv. oryzae KACC 10331]QBN96450.1 AAA family ATPase [Xanthomonas oryzae pv. oryzae]QBO00281.1 ATPase [Xanthomonas oryzae pv. oryzae]QIF23399.1 AAA family ATPase [Xanthomonas oryzae pv. oryzae]RBC69160.1 ATPase [Xanthomonas oryzae pv. oryzae]